MLNTESYNRTLLTRNVIPTYYRTNQEESRTPKLTEILQNGNVFTKEDWPINT